jgi:signal transduction histidine kinase
MTRRSARRACGWLLLSGVMLMTLAEMPALAASHQRQVLVLYSTRRDAQIAIAGERELPRVLDAGLGGNLDYYSEYLDRARIPDPAYQVSLRDFLRVKYKAIQFDIVIAVGEIALQFLAAHRHEVFPNVPLVYFSASPLTVRPPNSTGVTTEPNFRGTLQLATQLQPDARRVVVVSGAGGDDSAFERQARAQFRPFEPRLTFEYLAGLPTRDLEARLSALPPNSIIYYLVVDRDGDGQTFHPLEYLDRIAAIARAPIYCWVDSAMEHGIVGGSLKNQTAQIDAIAELALRVLRGEHADTIEPTSPDLNVVQVDWRQLRRWGIHEARVPPGTLVRFREPTVWDRYGTYVLAAAAVLLAQTILIAALLVQGTRRRRAEDAVLAKQSELRTSYERIRDLGGRLLHAQESERTHLARELHDDIGQQIALLSIDLELLRAPGSSAAEGLAGEALNRAQNIAKSVHDLSHRLYPARLRLIGLVPAIRGLQQEMSRADVTMAFTHQGVPSALPPDKTLCLFRIVQEALQNALKYSGARHLSVDLRAVPEGLTLTIDDDGRGFDVNAAWGKGLGLVSMEERIEAIGGTLHILSTPGAGTRLEATVPLSAAGGAATVAV